MNRDLEDLAGEPATPAPRDQTPRRPGRVHPLARVLIVVGLDIILANLAALLVVAILGRGDPKSIDTLVSGVTTRGDVFAVVRALAAPSTWILILMVRRGLDRRSFSSLGIRCSGVFLRGLLQGAAAGLAAVTLIAIAGLASGAFTRVEAVAGGEDVFLRMPPLLLACVLAVAFLIQSATEELTVRGYVQRNMLEWRSGNSHELRTPTIGLAIWVLLFPSALFGALHVLNPDFGVWPMVNTLLIGIILAAWVVRDGDLGGAMGFHAAWNFSLAAIYGLPLSGIETPGIWPLGYSDTAGPRLIAAFGGTRQGGATYGPEGGWALTLALLVCLALLLRPMLRWLHVQYRRAR